MKKLIVFPILILSSIGAFAQLSVKPTSNGRDSYIYVKDEILYVKGTINLTENIETQGGFAKHASINLREGAQLIQGGTTSNNTGDGFLSVQQTVPETNARAYTYWASPVGNPEAPESNSPSTNTNFGVNSLYENLNPLGLSAKQVQHTPELDGNLLPLTISTRWLYTHEDPGTEAEGDYDAIHEHNLAKAGFGFTMKGVGGAENQTISQLYEFRGRPNNGDFTIPVKGPSVIDPNDVPAPADVQANMTLSGNPYPSALDLNWLFYDTDNEALGAFYYYDEDRSTFSHYYSQKPFGYGVFVPGPYDEEANEPGFYTQATFYYWNSAGEAGGSVGSGYTGVSHRFAPIGQGIMFVGVNPGNAEEVTIKNSHRRYIKQGSSNSIFHRPDSGSGDLTSDDSDQNGNSEEERAIALAQLDNRTPQTRLNVIFNEELTRDMLLTFSNQSTDGYDRGMDGPHPGGMKSDAYFPIVMNNQSRPHVIYSTNFSVEKQIPIAFKMDAPGTIRILVTDVIRKPYNKMYLFDKVESTFRELRGGSLAGASLSLPTGDYYNRFFIVFRNNETLPYPKADLDEFIANVGLFQNNPIQNLQILNPEGYDIHSVNVFDMSGKLVISEKNLGDKTSHSFYTGHLSDGVYLVKLMGQNNMSLDYKAIIMNK